MKKYCVDRNYVVRTDKSSRTTLVYKCNNPTPCNWRIRAIVSEKTDAWKITKTSGPHTCLRVNVSQDHLNLDAGYMASELQGIIAKDASTKIKVLQEMMSKLANGYQPSYHKTWAAKQKVIGRIHGDWDDSHETLPRFLRAIEDANPGSVCVTMNTPSGIEGCVTFDRVFWAFGPSIEGFKHCRPVVSVDGTFLTGRYKGTMLIAVSQDPENQIFPLAFAIVEKEDKNNWGWFLDCLRLLVIGTDRQGLSLISDRHAGILSYLDDQHSYYWRPPYAEHRFCLRHFGANFHKRYTKQVGDEVKWTAMEGQRHKFKTSLEKLRRFANEEVYKELIALDKKKWTFAYDGGKRFGTQTTNCSESFNGILKEARHLPIMATVMCTFYKCVEFFNDRWQHATKDKAAGNDFSGYARAKYNLWKDKAVKHRVTVFNREDGLYEVLTPVHPFNPYKGQRKHKVDLGRRTCTCNKLQLWKIPCSHVIAVCNLMRLDPRSYFSKYWTVDVSLKMYGSKTFRPVRDQPYWLPYNGQRILPNRDRLRGKGRPKVTRIRNEMDEWVESRPAQTCGLCGQQGHNRRSCGRVGGPSTS